MQSNNNQYRIRVNGYIKVPQVRVIASDGSSLGIMATSEALRLAMDQNLDLIEINPKGTPPVVKIADLGKFRYEEKKKQAEARKNQKSQEVKEITFRPNTDENDLLHKLNSAKDFIAEGHKVKFTVKFRGREIVHPEVAKDKFNWIILQLENSILANPLISLEGKFMFMTVSPSKK